MKYISNYRISSYSFRGNYSSETILFWIWKSKGHSIRPKVTVHKCAETIQERKLFKGGNYMRNLQEQVRKAFCYQKLFWPFTAWITASNFKSFSRSLEQFFLTAGQNNFVTKYQFFSFLILQSLNSCKRYSRTNSYKEKGLHTKTQRFPNWLPSKSRYVVG